MLYFRPLSLSFTLDNIDSAVAGGGGGIVDKSIRFKQVFQLLLFLIVAFPVCSVRVYNLVKNSTFESPFSLPPPKLKMKTT